MGMESIVLFSTIFMAVLLANLAAGVIRYIGLQIIKLLGFALYQLICFVKRVRTESKKLNAA